MRSHKNISLDNYVSHAAEQRRPGRIVDERSHKRQIDQGKYDSGCEVTSKGMWSGRFLCSVALIAVCSVFLLFGHLRTFLCDLLLFPFSHGSLAFKNSIPTITLLKAFLLRSVLQVHLHFFRLSCLIDFSFYCVLTASSSYLIESCLIQMWPRRSNSV